MDRKQEFALALCSRILAIVGATMMGSGCSPTVSSGSGGAGQGGQASTGEGQGGASTGSNGERGVCFKPSPRPDTCPARNDSKVLEELPNHCSGVSYQFPSKRINATPDADDRCCYEVMCIQEGSGRPYTVGDASLTAARAHLLGWGGGDAPESAALSIAERAALADAWTRDALMEHASIASFGRVALELLAFGAPADLVEDSHRAALDEARHARLCFELASGYAGERLGPAPFPFGGAVALAPDLVTFARAVVREGCVGETVAAMLASEQLTHATDPAVRAALEVIAADEARHAELAWRTVAWAVGAGGAAVRDAAIDELARASSSLPSPADGPGAPAHGRIGGAAARAATNRALVEIIAPCARAFSGGATRS